MSKVSVAQFLEAAKRNEVLKERLKAAISCQSCVELANNYGYNFSLD